MGAIMKTASEEKVGAIIVAAGEGKRFGGRKQFCSLKGRPLLHWTLDKFENHPEVTDIILVLPPNERRPLLFENWSKLRAIVPGGPTRLSSVQAGFQALSSQPTGIVLVHDGVRPGLSPSLISRIINQARREGAALPVWPIEETVKEVAHERVCRTIDRSNLYVAQTPQGFSYSLLAKALAWAQEHQVEATDEASLIEQIGGTVTTVRGERRNIKITTAEDLIIMEAFLGDENRTRL